LVHGSNDKYSIKITADCIGLDVLLGHLETETAVRTVPEVERQESGESQEAKSQQLPDYTDKDQVIKYIREAEAIKKANNQVRITGLSAIIVLSIVLQFFSCFDLSSLMLVYCQLCDVIMFSVLCSFLIPWFPSLIC
jgi:hypothetical protein